MWRTLSAFVVAYSMTTAMGCTSRRDALRVRAVYDLQCQDAQLTVRRLGGDATGVWGCGRYAAYIDRCDSYGKCIWVLNSVTGALQVYAPPPGYYGPAPAYSSPAASAGPPVSPGGPAQ